MAPSSSSSQSSRSRPQAQSTRTPSRDLERLPASLRNLERRETAYISPYAPVTTRAQQETRNIFSPQPTQPAISSTNPLLSGNFPTEYRTPTTSMSTYSSSSQDSIYTSPGSQQYGAVTPGMMSNPTSISEVSYGKCGCMIPDDITFRVFHLSSQLHPVDVFHRSISADFNWRPSHPFTPLFGSTLACLGVAA